MDITVATPAVPSRLGFLNEAIASVVHQRYPAKAHSVVLDLAADGEAATRNRAWKAAETEWVAFLDDDDVFLPNHLEALVLAQEGSGADLVYPWYDMVGSADPNAGHFGREFKDEYLRQANFIPVTYLVRRSLLEETGGFPAPGWHDERGVRLPADQAHSTDWGFLLAALDAGAKFHHVPQKTWVWRIHADNLRGRLWTQAGSVKLPQPPMKPERGPVRPSFRPGLVPPGGITIVEHP